MIKPILKALTGLPNDVFYKKHLEILNPVLNVQLTTTEIEVLASFMALKGDIVEQDRFGTQARKIVMKKLNQSPGGLGNHLKELREKAFIYYDEHGKYKIKDFLLPDGNVIGYQFKIEKQE